MGSKSKLNFQSLYMAITPSDMNENLLIVISSLNFINIMTMEVSMVLFTWTLVDIYLVEACVPGINLPEIQVLSLAFINRMVSWHVK